MYSRNEIVLRNRTRIKGTRPFEPHSFGPEGKVPKPPPVSRWSGVWRPRVVRETLTMGTLSDDLAPIVARDPAAFGILTPMVAPTVQPTPFQLPAQTTESPSIWSSIMGGLSSIIGARVGGEVARQQQQAAARAWNPAITGPAIQAQAWQQAYSGGTGIMPNVGTGTLVVGGLLVLGLGYALLKK